MTSAAAARRSGDLFLTDGGIETVLIFHEGLELPLFAAFDLLKDEAGTEALRRYYAPYVALAASARARASSPRARRGGRARAGRGSSATPPRELDRLNRRAIALMEELRARHDPRS